MDSWDRSNQTFLPPKNDFYSELILEGISDKGYAHAQKVFNQYFTNMGHYYNLFVQTDTFLLANVSEKFKDKSIEIYGLDPSYFYNAPGLAWQACLKKNRSKIRIIS